MHVLVDCVLQRRAHAARFTFVFRSPCRHVVCIARHRYKGMRDIPVFVRMVDTRRYIFINVFIRSRNHAGRVQTTKR